MGAMVRDRLRLLALLRGVGAAVLAGSVALVVAASLIPPLTAVALASLVGRVATTGAQRFDSAVVVPLVLFAVVLLAGHVLDAVRQPLFYLVQARIDGTHRAALARLAATSDTIGALERPRVQRLVREAQADPENWTERTPGAGAVSQLQGSGRVVTLVSSGLVVAAYAWWLAPLLVVPAVVVQQLNRRNAVSWSRAWQRNSGELLGARLWSEAIISPGEGKDLRVFGVGEWALDRVETHMGTLYGPVFATAKSQIRRLWQQLMLLFVPMAVAFLVVSAAAARGHTSVAVAMAVLSAGSSVYIAFGGGDPRDVVGGLASLRAFDELREQLDAVRPSDRDAGPAAATTPAASGSAPLRLRARAGPRLVRFEDVDFAYPGTRHQVLSGLELEIRPGELLAIVGMNGSGKSTLIKLLAGLYSPDRGRIVADGVDVAELGPAAWRQQLAIVFQDFVRYHLSALDNVALGNAAVPVDRTAVEEAARAAGFDEVLSRLPRGWDTPLARTRTDGVDLSGGQWQQVVLARALYAMRTGAWLLVLDEPTAHLDVRTEFEVFERLADHKGDASVVLISHRLSTVRRADRIVLLDGGRVAESGTHEELMAAGGAYAGMFTIQADRFRRGYDDRLENGELI